jgi:DNA-binding NtrC family response regulator
MGTKVLIVDDEVEFATTLCERLGLRGYETRAICVAQDALPAVKSDPPDVILLDLKMPGKNGIEILMTVKNFAPEIEVILLTGHMSLDNKLEGIKLDAFDCILKPVDIKELTGKIDKAAEKSKLNRE